MMCEGHPTRFAEMDGGMRKIEDYLPFTLHRALCSIKQLKDAAVSKIFCVSSPYSESAS